MDEYRYCPVCGAEYSAKVLFCPDCFAMLVREEELQRPKSAPSNKRDGYYMYCPYCGAEYDPDTKECGDCFVKLVSAGELQKLRTQAEAQVKQSRQAVVYIAQNSAEAQEITELLQREGLQATVELVDTEAAGLTFTPGLIIQVVVPPAQQEKALFILQYVLSAPAGEPNAQEDISEKKRRLEAAIEAEEAGLPALEEFFGEAGELRRRSMDAALEFVEGVDVLINWVVRNCLEQELSHGLMRAVGEACRMLGEEEPEQATREFAPGLKNPDAWVRWNFCFALGRLGADPAIRHLVGALRDPDPEVRSEAIDQLYSLEGTDLGYDSDLEPEEQPEALARWQKLASEIDDM